MFLAGAFSIGPATAHTVVPIRIVIQDEIPPERMARVAALSEAANTAAMLIVPFVGAAIAGALSLGYAFVAGGVLALAKAGLAWRADRAG